MWQALAAASSPYAAGLPRYHFGQWRLAAGQELQSSPMGMLLFTHDRFTKARMVRELLVEDPYLAGSLLLLGRQG
ncbi:MAG: hypothetical protein ACRYFX_22195 [Janthinobacterium lividum]